LTLYNFLSGWAACGFLVGALLFLRSWRRTRDGLFVAFSSAFALLGIGQAVLALGNLPTEERSYVYLFRLAAFSLIIFAIVRKNRSN